MRRPPIQLICDLNRPFHVGKDNTGSFDPGEALAKQTNTSREFFGDLLSKAAVYEEMLKRVLKLWIGSVPKRMLC